jgi:HEAT repeat protein
MQLSAWVAKGSRELKMNLIGLIEELGDPQGGPALRSALLDRDPEIAAMAAQVVGKVHFTAGVPMLIKAVRLRETRYEDNEDFLTAVCQAMGRLGQHEAVPFLKDIARKKSMLMGKNFSVELRLQAVEALSKIDDPESRRFLEDLQQERTPALKETIDRILSEKGS